MTQNSSRILLSCTYSLGFLNSQLLLISFHLLLNPSLIDHLRNSRSIHWRQTTKLIMWVILSSGRYSPFLLLCERNRSTILASAFRFLCAEAIWVEGILASADFKIHPGTYSLWEDIWLKTPLDLGLGLSGTGWVVSRVPRGPCESRLNDAVRGRRAAIKGGVHKWV
jgi:hypothetical protein